MVIYFIITCTQRPTDKYLCKIALKVITILSIPQHISPISTLKSYLDKLPYLNNTIY